MLGERDKLARFLNALDAAAKWCDRAEHRHELAEMLARPDYVGIAAELIARALAGRMELGAGRRLDDPDFMYFHRAAANEPRREDALWIYAQMRRWGQLPLVNGGEAAAAELFRSDIYHKALRIARRPDAEPPEAFDGVRFEPDDVEGYVARFSVRAPGPHHNSSY